jgi:hypothetical protein
MWAVGAPTLPFRPLALGSRRRTRTSSASWSIGDSPNAYAYLIVLDGSGPLSVVLTRFQGRPVRLNGRRPSVPASQAIDHVDVRAGGGMGGSLDAFHRPTIGPPSLGEAAGFQDYLWGFGIRYALQSGDVAARALMEGTDYTASVAREIRPLIQASLRLRTLYDRVGDRGDHALVRGIATVGIRRDPAPVVSKSQRSARSCDHRLSCAAQPGHPP